MQSIQAVSVVTLAFALAASPASAQAVQQAGDRVVAGEIVVTAQRRAELLRDVPITMSVQTGEQLEKTGIQTIQDLSYITPGVRIDVSAGTAVQPSIRGISSISQAAGEEANVALYIDGVLQPVMQANRIDLVDIERVEVLKGPQGTLFGRNATGGAIRITTLAPSFDWTGKGRFSYGRFDEYEAKAYISGPLVPDLLAFSLAGYYRHSEGFLSNDSRPGQPDDDFGENSSKEVRGKLLIQPASNLDITLIGGLSKVTDGNALFSSTAINGNAAARLFLGLVPPPSGTIPQISEKPFHPSVEYAGAGFTKRSHFSGNLSLQTDIGEISATTGYLHTRRESRSDGDWSTLPLLIFANKQINEVWSHEGTFASNKFGPVSFTLGGFLYNRKVYDVNIRDAGLFAGDVSQGAYTYAFVETNAWALFGEANLDITDQLSLIAGLRYSDERRKGYNDPFFTEQSPFPRASDLTFKAKVSADSFTPRFVLRYAVDPRTNVYASYSKGFKSGGLSMSVVPPFGGGTYDPESIDAYEVGIKTDQGPLSLTASTYYYAYDDLQVITIQDLASVTDNAAKAEVYGLELGVSASITPEFELSAGAVYNHATYKKFDVAVVNAPTTVGGACPNFNCGNLVPLTVDASGNDLGRAPRYTFNLQANYEKDISAGTLAANALFYYTSRQYFTPDERITQKGYEILNGSISFAPANTPVKFSVWGRNLTDSRYLSGVFIFAFGDGGIYAPPRSYGVAVDFSF